VAGGQTYDLGDGLSRHHRPASRSEPDEKLQRCRVDIDGIPGATASV